MSYQPFPGAGTPTPPPSSRGRRNPALLVIGVIVLVAGVVGGLVLLLGASSSTEDSVKDLGRAPAGCTTTLQFEQTGTFLVFFERTGTVDDLGGGCPNTGDFDRADDTVPDQSLTLTDPDGDDVTIDDASGVDYDAGGFAGSQIGSVDIDVAGDYELTVSPDDADDIGYAIAVGKDPTANETSMQIAGIAALAGGLLIGGLLIALGARRRGRVTPLPAAGPSWPQATVGPTVMWPPAPPTAPPYGGPPTAFGGPGNGSFGPPGAATPGSSGLPGWPPTTPRWPPVAQPPSSPADPTRPEASPDPFSRPPGG